MDSIVCIIVSIFFGLASSLHNCNHGEIAQDASDVSCRSFYLCAHGHQMLMTCAPGTMFDPDCLCCNHATMVSCSTAAASSLKGACEQNFGIYSNPVDPTCSTFIQCSWSEPYVKDCNPGLLFNPVSKTCDFPANVECNVKAPEGAVPVEKKLKVVLNPIKLDLRSNRDDSAATPRVVCFYPNWSYWRKAMGKFAPSDIDPKLCSHIVYAYSVMDAENLVMKAGDDWLDVEKGNFKSFVQLKQQNPDLKALIAIGGWVDSQQNHDAYNLVFNNEMIRSNFITSLKDFLKNWGFDGVDLSYQFPQTNEREGFAFWAKSIKKAFGDKYELTASVPANTKKLLDGYDIAELSKHLDFFNIMTYDMHGPWESYADHHSPLYRRKWDTSYNYIDATVQYLIDHGAPQDKIVIGIPSYGRSWSTKDPHQWLPMQPPVAAKGAAPAGFLTKSAGSMGYMEICLKVKNAGWVEVDDPEGPYAYSNDRTIWVGYDSPGSVADKAQYILDRKLGGAMLWDLPQDDFSNACGKGKFPLLKSINRVFTGDLSR